MLFDAGRVLRCASGGREDIIVCQGSFRTLEKNLSPIFALLVESERDEEFEGVKQDHFELMLGQAKESMTQNASKVNSGTLAKRYANRNYLPRGSSALLLYQNFLVEWYFPKPISMAPFIASCAAATALGTLIPQQSPEVSFL